MVTQHRTPGWSPERTWVFLVGTLEGLGWTPRSLSAKTIDDYGMLNTTLAVQSTGLRSDYRRMDRIRQPVTRSPAFLLHRRCGLTLRRSREIAAAAAIAITAICTIQRGRAPAK
jgi:hypothetical protein